MMDQNNTLNYKGILIYPEVGGECISWTTIYIDELISNGHIIDFIEVHYYNCEVITKLLDGKFRLEAEDECFSSLKEAKRFIDENF